MIPPTMIEKIDTIIVGAGVVGLAIAREMALAGNEVIVLEAKNAIGTEISARNSEVIHAGIYYPAGTLKAKLCRPGRNAIYEYCETHAIAHHRVGKLIVATSLNELKYLHKIQGNAEANGVEDLQLLNSNEARAMEPALECAGALFSPSTGIIDSHSYMLALQGDAETLGAVIALSSPMEGGTLSDKGITIHIGGAEPLSLKCRHFINAAGLKAQAVASKIEGFPVEHIPPLYYAKGNYFTLSGKSPFQKMIYPVPVKAGLGIHSTIDLAGQTKFGPDVQWIDSPNYTVDISRTDDFYRAIRRYWPELSDNLLQPGYVGVRPKLVPQGAPPGDWDIKGPELHGIKGIINLFGIESPGLTSSLAIAKYVSELLK
jgi:L-2-hydroxyglutarate oxidase LhgO